MVLLRIGPEKFAMGMMRTAWSAEGSGLIALSPFPSYPIAAKVLVLLNVCGCAEEREEEEARKAWPDKALWLNCPGSVHIQEDEAIAAQTRRFIEEAGSRRGFAIGITEDIPPDHWARTMRVIARTIGEVG